MIVGKIEMTLRNYPILLGSGSPIAAYVVSLIDTLDPILRFVALCIGGMVAFVTLLIKVEDLLMKRLERRQKVMEIEVNLNT